MPASRTRKKTSQKKTAAARKREQQARHKAFKRRFGSAVDEIPACGTCSGDRVELLPEQVPATTWAGMAPMRADMAAQGAPFTQVAYCAHCNQYSLLSDWAAG